VAAGAGGNLGEVDRARLLRAFGDRLRGIRKRAGYTQDSLAAATGLSRDGLAHLERGTRQPRLITLLILADGLGVSPAELLDGLSVSGLRAADSSQLGS